MQNEFVPRKASKSQVKLKIGVQGPSGSGKTWNSLALARNMWPDARICVIDTENMSSELYADRWDFDTIPLHAPFTTERYIQAMQAAIDAGYDVLIVDSITHQWAGDGGILRRKEELDRRPGSNSYTNWASFTPEHERFKNFIVQSPIHTISTLRSDQEYALTEKDGKKRVEKLGMSPIQRAGFGYEFSIVFDLQMDHVATVDKDRTALFNGRQINLSDPKIAKELRTWLESGKAQEATPAPTAPTPRPAQPAPHPATSTSEPPVSPANPYDSLYAAVPANDEYISTELAHKLSTLADLNNGGINKKQFTEFLTGIGYSQKAGTNAWMCIRNSQFRQVHQWILEHKKAA